MYSQLMWYKAFDHRKLTLLDFLHVSDFFVNPP